MMPRVAVVVFLALGPQGFAKEPAASHVSDGPASTLLDKLLDAVVYRAHKESSHSRVDLNSVTLGKPGGTSCRRSRSSSLNSISSPSASCVVSTLPAGGRLRPEIILFGDSITQQSFGPGGWGASLTNAYCRHADVTLRGYSGYNTRWAMYLLPRVFAPELPAPLLVTVLLGANDANLPPPLHCQPAMASRQHVPIDEYVDNLRKIVEAPRRMGDGSARVLLISPPPVDTEAWRDHCIRTYGVKPTAEANRNFEATKRYADACVALGNETNTPTLDLHTAFVRRDNWSSLLSDGLHPNSKGGKVIAKEVLKAIKEHYPSILPAWYPEDGFATGKLPQDFPDHQAIDHENNNVEGSFSAHAQRVA